VTRRVESVALACVALAAGGCRGSDDSADESHSAAQAFAPRLHVEQRPSLPGRATTLTIAVTQRRGERVLRRADVVAPPGFRIDPPRGSVGVLDAAVASRRGETVVTGQLERAADWASCGDGRATPLVAVLGPAPSLRVRIALRATAAATRLRICPEGDRVVHRLTIRLNRGLTAPSVGDAVWRGIFTPARGEATESRAVVPAPSFLTLEAAGGTSVAADTPVRITGYLLQREPQPHRQIRILAGPTLDRLEIVGRARTRANGSYRFTLTAPNVPGAIYVAARAASVERECAAAAGCTTTTDAARAAT
jgi:hypothetical protein